MMNLLVLDDPSRGHPKWWISEGIPPKCPNNSGLGMIEICPDGVMIFGIVSVS